MTRSTFRSAALWMGASMLACALVACDDKNDPAPVPPVEDPVPGVTLSPGQPTSSSVTFTVTPEKAEVCTYMALKEGEEIPDVSVVLAQGKQVSASAATEVTVSDLLSETAYVVLAAVSNDKKTAMSEPLRLTTLAAQQPDNAVVLDRMVQATYYGVNHDFGFGANYYLQLSNVDCSKDEYGYFHPTGTGTLLRLDFWGEPSPDGATALPNGTYLLDPVHDPLTVNPHATGIALSDGEEITESYFEAGEVTVQREGDIYTVVVSMTDSEQVLYEYKFTGAITWETYVPPTYDPITKDVDTNFTGADGLYYGDRDKNGLGFFEVYFYDVPLDGGFLSGAGNMLILDIYAPLGQVTDDFLIPDGIYTLNGTGGGAYSFIPGYLPEEDAGYLLGSSCEQDDEDGSPFYAAINGGTMEFRHSGTTCTATFNLTTVERITITGTYTGEIPMEDRIGWRPGGGGYSTLHRDVTPDLSGIASGELTYLGDYMRVDCASYVLDISAEGEREAMQIEVLCEPDNVTDVAVGHYTVMPGRIQDNYVPWAVLPGYMTNMNTSGTWYFAMDAQGEVNNGGPANGGILDISKRDKLYTVTFDFEDDCTEPNRISGSWTGELNFVSIPFSLAAPVPFIRTEPGAARFRIPRDY